MNVNIAITTKKLKIYNDKNMKAQIKSKDRIRDLAEVYTSDKEINAILDLLGDVSFNIDYRYLEPSCGNGNFLVAILERKMKKVCSQYKKIQEFEFYSLKAISSLYGVDIDKENIEEAKNRMKDVIIDRFSDSLNTKKPNYGFYKSVDYILKKNIIKGDMINGIQKIKFTEFTSPKLFKFQQKIYALPDLMKSAGSLWESNPEAIEEIPLVNYLELDK